MAGGRKRSWVWKYFVPEGGGKSASAICKVCEAMGKMVRVTRSDSSTRNMISHLEKHGIDQFTKRMP